MNAAQAEFDALVNQNEKSIGHPEDRHQRSDSEGDSDNERQVVKDRAPSNPTPPSSYSLPYSQFDANTGPKGVIADAQAFEKARRQAAYRRSSMRTPTVTTNGYHQDSKLYESEKHSSPEPEEDDEAFMRTWRQSRLAQLNVRPEPPRRKSSPSKRSYGWLETVDAIGYLDAVEKVPADTVVVVCIYDKQSEVSRMVEDCVMALAQKHVTTRFVKLHFTDAEMDVAAVPAILAYKAGDLIANLVSIIDEIPPGRDLSASTLEMIFKQ
ncbi:MAG: hypothetical protein M1812_004124 [Candelaria pacifica]|nr:MAG: hypothetical protein M1812_004124 [Candelaria pacifica]